MMLPQLRNALVRESSTLESSIEMQGCLYVRNSEWHGDAAVELGPDLNAIMESRYEDLKQVISIIRTGRGDQSVEPEGIWW